jgi:hypothetical protein
MQISHRRAGRTAQAGMRSAVFVATVVGIGLTTAICSAAQPIRVSCALPYANGHSDPSCVGKNTVVISTSNTSANAKISSEVLGLDTTGTLINSIPVKNGDLVQLGSKLSPTDWKFDTGKNQQAVFAPVPLLHVKVEDQGQTAEAFCSNIPFVEMIQPNGGVVTDSDGNSTKIVAAVPLTSPQSLQLNIDGVNILTQIPNYLACTAFAPCSGTVNVNGNTIGYSNLIVDVASSISAPASNTVSATINDLTCGGHNFQVSTTKQPDFPSQVGGACYVDSLSKKATSSVFGISISDPTPGKITPLIPTPVAGQVCSGSQITSVSINGKNLSVAGEIFTPGSGSGAGDKYVVPINTTLDKSDLVRDALTRT